MGEGDKVAPQHDHSCGWLYRSETAGDPLINDFPLRWPNFAYLWAD